MARKLRMVISLVICALYCDAQILKPVTWSYGYKKINALEAVIFIKAIIADGWHVYSTNQADGGPVKTSFTFEPSGDYALMGTLTEPQPMTKYEKTFMMDVKYFEKEVIFQQKVKLKTRQAAVKGKLNYMVCNDHQCLPPTDVAFEIPIK